MKEPWDDPQMFIEKSPITYVKNVKTPTLIIHGEVDRDVPVEQAYLFHRALSELGVEVELVNKEWKTYLQDIDTLSYEVARAGWIGDYNDPMTFLDMWVSGNGNNDTGWSNPEYDNLIKQAQAEPSVRQRRNYLQEAEKLLLEQGPVIPIYFYTNNMLASRQLEGFHEHNRDIHLFKYMSLPEK